ncbi:DUF4258 domain-containing protein [Patescibacteria group bacterium]|nr:DUF4258 domain-containing protein [Patescibacteria group bacterium]
MDRRYGGVIWTNHALERLGERGISQGDAWVAFTKPDQSRYAQNRGGWIYYKTIHGWKIEVVAKQNERKEWIVLSVWAKPVFWQKEYTTVKKRHWFTRLLRQIFLGDYR